MELEAKRMRANEMLIEHYEVVAQVEALEKAAGRELEILGGKQSSIQTRQYGTENNRRTNRRGSLVEKIALEKQRAAERLERINRERTVLYKWIEEIDEILDKMTSRQRQIIYMRYKEKKSLKFIARKYSYSLDDLQEKILPEILDCFINLYEFGRSGCTNQTERL